MVTTHLAKNAHHYWDIDKDTANKIKLEAEAEVRKKKSKTNKMDTAAEQCIEVQRTLHEIRMLKRQNRIHEQQDLVAKVRTKFPTYRELSKASRIALKTVHEWCSLPKE